MLAPHGAESPETKTIPFAAGDSFLTDRPAPSTFRSRETLDGPVTHEPFIVHVALPDQVPQAAHLTAPVLLWRGVNGLDMFADQWGPDLTGMERTEASYLSTSANLDVADIFTPATNDPAAPTRASRPRRDPTRQLAHPRPPQP